MLPETRGIRTLTTPAYRRLRMTPMRIVALIGTVLLVALPAGLASAQPQTAPSQDVQVTSEAIARTCGEVHKNPGAQADGPGIGPGGNLVINCRLLGTGGMTLGQVSPEEVCQRLTGSTEWYRGMGTQVYCRVATATAPAPAPRSFTMNEEDIARACQKIHRNPQATALPPKLGPSGLELGCRLVNESGVTLAQVTPEDVCETKFGVRDWVGVAGTPTFVCKGNSTVLPNKPPAGQQDAAVTAAPPSGPPNDVPLVPEASSSVVATSTARTLRRRHRAQCRRRAGRRARGHRELRCRGEGERPAHRSVLSACVGHAGLVSDRFRQRHLDARRDAGCGAARPCLSRQGTAGVSAPSPTSAATARPAAMRRQFRHLAGIAPICANSGQQGPRPGRHRRHLPQIHHASNYEVRGRYIYAFQRARRVSPSTPRAAPGPPRPQPRRPPRPARIAGRSKPPSPAIRSSSPHRTSASRRRKPTVARSRRKRNDSPAAAARSGRR